MGFQVSVRISWPTKYQEVGKKKFFFLRNRGRKNIPLFVWKAREFGRRRTLSGNSREGVVREKGAALSSICDLSGSNHRKRLI